MEIAVVLQRHRSDTAHLDSALALYDHALALCPSADRLLRARITAHRAIALQVMPGADPAYLDAAHDAYQQAVLVLAEAGLPDEVADAEMNRGLVLQALAELSRARFTEAIAAYRRALRTFDRVRFSREFATMQSNLASCLRNLPDDPIDPEHGARNLNQARACYQEAREIVSAQGERDKAQSAGRACGRINRELLAGVGPGRAARRS
jgi:tetratricopeptide (TPR) repeat protein